MKVEIGDKLIAIEEVRYFMGQAEDDCIREGELVTVDGISRIKGCVFVHEHANRYGPYQMESFRKATTEEVEQHYLNHYENHVRKY